MTRAEYEWRSRRHKRRFTLMCLLATVALAAAIFLLPGVLVRLLGPGGKELQVAWLVAVVGSFVAYLAFLCGTRGWRRAGSASPATAARPSCSLA
jgi:putative exporter of polyketide antibiotics